MPVRYVSPDEDSARWLEVPLRPGDIVISARSKSGTTWVQMICALLVLQVPDLPASLHLLSPWVDWVGTPVRSLVSTLSSQHHRRFLKTHTPLDGLPLRRDVHHVVVARHPLDAAVSLHHQGRNLDRERIARLTGQPHVPRDRPPLPEWLAQWIEGDPDPRAHLDSLPGVLMHATDAWSRRLAGNVVLVHFEDLRRDLEAEMRRLAAALHLEVPDASWPSLVEAARFESMRSRAGALAPDVGGVLKDTTAFFRRGASGEGEAILSAGQLRRYHERASALAPAEVLEWLHHGHRQRGVPPGAPPRPLPAPGARRWGGGDDGAAHGR